MADHRKSRLQHSKHVIVMPAEYFNETIRIQLCSLLREDALKDITVVFSASNLSVNASVMALLSPVLRNMVCGQFKESIDRKIILDDVDKEHFLKLLHLGCGEAILDANNLEPLVQIAQLSERLQMSAVTAVLENRLIQALKVETCVEMLGRAEASGLKRLHDTCYNLVNAHFDEISKTDALLQLSEEKMELLLEEDELQTGREEDLFEAVVRWMTNKGQDRHPPREGQGLLRKIRFGVIGDAYLAESVTAALPGHDGLQQLVAEAMMKKGTRLEELGTMWNGVESLCEKWLVPRGLKGKMFGAEVLIAPEFVGIDRQGRILVSDSSLHQVVVFDHHGSVADRIGSEGEGEGQFYKPAGIAVDQQGNIFIADCGNDRIQMFGADGSFVRCFGSKGKAVGQFLGPEGVAIDMEGRIVVADRLNHRIQVLKPDGSVAFHFGWNGEAVGELKEPSGVAVDSTGRIVVCESGNDRIQVFNKDGSVALCFGSNGCGVGELDGPEGVAVDREGRLVVAEFCNRRIQVFNADGSVNEVIEKFPKHLDNVWGYERLGPNMGELRNPTGVAVDGAGRVLVADTRIGRRQRPLHGRVQVL